jgi:hypothetical protein
MMSPAYRQCSRSAHQKEIAAVNRVETDDGGVVFCVGRGSPSPVVALTILLDDPLKDRGSGQRRHPRRPLACTACCTRLMNKYGTVVIIQTRWNEAT